MYQDLFIPITTILIMLGITFFTLSLDDILNKIQENARSLYGTCKRSITNELQDNEEGMEMKNTDI